MDRRQYIRDALGNLRFRMLRRVGARPGHGGMARSVALALVVHHVGDSTGNRDLFGPTLLEFGTRDFFDTSS